MILPVDIGVFPWPRKCIRRLFHTSPCLRSTLRAFLIWSPLLFMAPQGNRCSAVAGLLRQVKLARQYRMFRVILSFNSPLGMRIPERTLDVPKAGFRISFQIAAGHRPFCLTLAVAGNRELDERSFPQILAAAPPSYRCLPTAASPRGS